MPDFTDLSRPTYSISTDIGGQSINVVQLTAAINADSIINATRTCHAITVRKGILMAKFDADLTTPAQTDALTSVISAYSFVAPVVVPNNVDTTDETATNADNYEPMNAMTITPIQAKYHVSFSASGSHSKKSADAEYAIFVGGVKVANSERSFAWSGGRDVQNFHIAMHSQAEVSVNGHEAVEVRWHAGGKGQFTCYMRSLMIVRIF